MEVKRGYKHTDVGVIPEEWETRPLGDLLQGPRSIRYGIVQPGKFEPTGCLMLRSQDYSKGWAGPDGMHRVSAHLENQYRNAKIRHKDLIITVVGAGIGQVVFAPDWLDGAILSRSTARIAIDEDKAAPSFVQAFLEGPVGKRQILDCQKEGAQPVVSCLDLAKFFLACPPLPEQRAIADALSDVDALLGALDRLIAKKRDLKQAAMQQLLTGQTRLPGFHDEWEVLSLDQIVLRTTGVWGAPTFDDSHPKAAEVIRAGDISPNGELTGTASRFLSEPEFSRARCQLDDLVITTSGNGLGKVWWCDGRPNVAASNFVRVLRPIKPKAEGRYLSHLLRSGEAVGQLQQHTATSAYPNLRATFFSTCWISLPAVPEQTAIAEVLSDMHAEAAGLEQRREKTRALKQGMMQELLTGRTRLV